MRELKKFVSVVCVIAGLFFVNAYAQPPTVYTEQNLNILVTAQNPQFQIKLKSNPTTGYSWFLREYDANLIQPMQHEFQAPQNKKLMGAPGYEVWSFVVKPAAFSVPQQTSIHMVYARPWQTQDETTQLVFKVSTSAGQ